jgi:hypothetical protein
LIFFFARVGLKGQLVVGKPTSCAKIRGQLPDVRFVSRAAASNQDWLDNSGIGFKGR